MALIVLGLFVLVWVISAIVKATQDPGRKKPPAGIDRQRPNDGPRVERTSNTDIDRFMAEIDRLRRRGEGAPAGPARPVEAPRPAPRPVEAPRPARVERAPRPADERKRDRRPRQARVSPPPLPPVPETVPVLRPVLPDRPAPAPPAPPPPARPARLAKLAGVSSASLSAPPSEVMKVLQSVLRSREGPAAAVILAEIFGEPRSRKMFQKGKHGRS